MSERTASGGRAQTSGSEVHEIKRISADMARAILPVRQPGAHKWDVGALVIIGGSPSYIGAVALSTMAAQRSGAGIVQLAVPRGIVTPLASMVPEAVYIPLPESESAGGARAATALIAEKVERATALLIGPGLGQDSAADGLLHALFDPPGTARSIGFGFSDHSEERVSSNRQSDENVPLGRRGIPTVIDADGLNWLAEQADWPALLTPESSVLTPHPGELARLLKCEVSEIIRDTIAAVGEAARRSRQVVILKYDHTAVSDGERTLIAPAAPLSLASAGTGDVLGGMVASFLAQGMVPFDAATLAVYLGCQAALQLEPEVGTLGLVASDLPRAVAAQIAILERQIVGGE